MDISDKNIYTIIKKYTYATFLILYRILFLLSLEFCLRI